MKNINRANIKFRKNQTSIEVCIKSKLKLIYIANKPDIMIKMKDRLFTI